MKKLAALAVALVASAGVGTMAAAAPDSQDRIKVRSKIVKLNATSTGFGPYRTVTVKGKVNAKIGNKKSKKACRKRRKVRVQGLGKTRTNKKGRFSIQVGAPPPGTYKVKAKKKKTKVAGRKLLCKRAKRKLNVP